MRAWAGAVGVVFVIAGVSLRPPTNSLRPSEVTAAFSQLVDAPLQFTPGGSSADLTATIPDDDAWRRIRRFWGDPGYIVAAVPSSSHNYLYCLNQLGLAVRLTVDGKSAEPDTASFPPYGYSANCTPVGVRFAAPPRSRIHVLVSGRVSGASEGVRIVVEPYWTVGAKDHLVEQGITEQLHLEVAWRVSVILGVALAAYGFWPALKKGAKILAY